MTHTATPSAILNFPMTIGSGSSKKSDVFPTPEAVTASPTSIVTETKVTTITNAEGTTTKTVTTTVVESVSIEKKSAKSADRTPTPPTPALEKKTTTKRTTTAIDAVDEVDEGLLQCFNKLSQQDMIKFIPGIGKGLAKTMADSKPYLSWDDVRALDGIGERRFTYIKKAVAEIAAVRR